MVIQGQKKMLEYSERLLQQESLPPALLLHGPRGSGRGYLAHKFAARLLCRSPETAPCGACGACLQIAAFRHPDLLLFSGRNIGSQLTSWRAVASVTDPAPMSGAVLQLLYRLEQQFARGFFKVKKSASVKDDSGRKKTEKLDADGFVAFLSGLEEQLKGPPASGQIKEIIDELVRLTLFISPGVLPVDGIRKIIAVLARRPLLGGRRVLIIEEAEQLRQEAANAFLKTLEDPSPGTIIILTAESHKNVLPTIRSRCAIVPVFKMRSEEMERLAASELGITGPLSAEGCAGFYEYLRSFSEESRAVQDLLVRLFECLEAGERDDSFYPLSKEAVDNGLAEAVIEELELLFSRTLLARQTDVGAMDLFIHLVDGVDGMALESLRKEAEEVLKKTAIFHLNPQQALLSLYYGLFQARWS